MCPAKKVGRPNPNGSRRLAICEKFGLKPTERRIKVDLTVTFMDKLDRCKDDAARRILLGVSEKES